MMRLQKYLARAGVASRRASESLISSGRVRVNGRVADELGTKVGEGDVVELDGKVVEPPCADITVMLNKPIGYLTSMSDPYGRPTVADLVPVDEYPSLFPVGRLDMDTSGLLLFTTDGELGNRLLHPRFHVDKTYIATIDEAPSPDELSALRRGIELDDGITAPAQVKLLCGRNSGAREKKARVEMVIHEGRKRQVRRMLEATGHKVCALERISFGGLDLGNLESGKWRPLSDGEISMLRASSSC